MTQEKTGDRCDGRFRRRRLVPGSVLGTLSLTLFLGLAPSPGHAVQKPIFLTPLRAVVAPSGAQGLCRTNAWACSVSRTNRAISAADLPTLDKINRSVNRRVRSISDRAQFNVEEKWTLPTARGGDCEDFALLKKRELIRLGYPAQSLLIATVLDKKRRGHAVLVVRTEAGDLVLDNLTNSIKTWGKTGYVFLRMQNPSAPSRWVTVEAR